MDVHLDLTDVSDGDLLEGVIRVAGRLPMNFEPDARTRIEISQWLPADMARPSTDGWDESFEQLDATLLRLQTTAIESA